MVVVIIQADDLVDSISQRHKKRTGGKCEFDNSLEEICLRPISFISRSTVSPLENPRHRCVGESVSVRWSIRKFKITCGYQSSRYFQIAVEGKKYLNQKLMYHRWYTYGEPNCCNINL